MFSDLEISWFRLPNTYRPPPNMKLLLAVCLTWALLYTGKWFSLGIWFVSRCCLYPHRIILLKCYRSGYLFATAFHCSQSCINRHHMNYEGISPPSTPNGKRLNICENMIYTVLLWYSNTTVLYLYHLMYLVYDLTHKTIQPAFDPKLIVKNSNWNVDVYLCFLSFEHSGGFWGMFYL